jgi:hypothetical protein
LRPQQSGRVGRNITRLFTRSSRRDLAEAALKGLDRLVGVWTTEGVHPALPGVVVRGNAVFEWLEGARFRIHRAHVEHPDFPDAISIIGFTDQDRVHGGGDAAAAAEPQLSMHYFDSRGVFRLYDASIDDASWRFQRIASGFSQRFVGTFADGGDSIVGVSQLCKDDVHWHDDLKITYRRRHSPD